MVKTKKFAVCLILLLSFTLGYVYKAYGYNILLTQGFTSTPAAIRMYDGFAYETKVSICDAAVAWSAYDTEYIYTLTVYHNSDTYANHNEYNDITRGYRGADGYVAQYTYVHTNNPLTTCYETDIDLNIDLPLGDASNNSNVYDIQSAIEHEFGHLLGLDDDMTTSTDVMYDNLSKGQLKRNISTDDRLGIMDIYN